MNRAKFAAAAAAVLIGGVATAALAHPHPDGEKKERKVIVITDGDHDGEKRKIRRVHVERIDGDRKDGHPRVLRLHRDGKGPRMVHLGHLTDCEGGEKLVDESAGDDKNKTKVIICSKGDDEASRAERLERALARIEANEQLDAEHKSRIAASLRDAIERERSGR